MAIRNTDELLRKIPPHNNYWQSHNFIPLSLTKLNAPVVYDGAVYSAWCINVASAKL